MIMETQLLSYLGGIPLKIQELLQLPELQKEAEQSPVVRLLLEVIRRQEEENQALRLQIKSLQEEVKRLKNQSNLDSHNSSKPPSSDLSKKPRPIKERKKPKKKRGGQKGHAGKTLLFRENPDEKVLLSPNHCLECNRSLKKVPLEHFERRQVFELPPISLRVTEFVSETKKCPCCKKLNSGQFPSFVKQPVQYGSRFQAFVAYLHHYQMIPYKRLSELCQDLFGQSLSQGTTFQVLKRLSSSLSTTQQWIRKQLLQEKVLHFDETGLYQNGKRIWLHTVSSQDWTLYFAHPKRGRIALEEVGVLPHFQGIAVHDHYESYKKFLNCQHAYCNAHHLRELARAEEQEEQNWAEKMAVLLRKIYRSTQRAISKGRFSLAPSTRLRYRVQYESILDRAKRESSLPDPPKKQGRWPKQPKWKNLLDRLDKHESEVLSFMKDFDIPFDNNLAERDLRMIKIKQKVSGCFRSEKGTEYFCLIRGLISSLRKQGKNILESIKEIFALDSPQVAPAFVKPE